MRKARKPFVKPGTTALPVATNKRDRESFLAAVSIASCLTCTSALPALPRLTLALLSRRRVG